jgi:quinol monooxygenase YgiN
MVTRILDFQLKLEKKDEFVKTIKNEVVPILRKQPGFLEILPFVPENLKENKIVTITLWTNKLDAERYEREVYPRMFDILKPFLTTPVNVRWYNLETTVCQHFVEALAA